jgi:hypothetical protein
MELERFVEKIEKKPLPKPVASKNKKTESLVGKRGVDRGYNDDNGPKK